jgi:hypothetical protein
MTNEERLQQYLTALSAFSAREGHARVPASHVETLADGSPVNLGAWVGYIRQRKRAGLLPQSRVDAIGAVPGWEWGPLRPGPTADAARNTEILTLRSQGVSLQRIGDQFGLSRQRVHQIVTAHGIDA